MGNNTISKLDTKSYLRLLREIEYLYKEKYKNKLYSVLFIREQFFYDDKYNYEICVRDDSGSRGFIKMTESELQKILRKMKLDEITTNGENI